MIPIYYFLALTSILFCLGLYGVMTKRNAVRILMGIELMFNAGIINFVVFNIYGALNKTSSTTVTSLYTGQVVAVLSIALAAADAAVGLSLLLVLYRNWQKIDVSEMELLKG